MHSPRNLLSHAIVAGAATILASFTTYIVVTGQADRLALSSAYAQASGNRSTEVITQAMPDIAREMRISVTERDPGNASTPHRHPGHHTFGYVLEGTYEVKIDDGPLRQLKAGESFYEPPGLCTPCHAIPAPIGQSSISLSKSATQPSHAPSSSNVSFCNNRRTL